MMIKKCIKLLRDLIHKICRKIWFRIKLWEMDDWWYYTGERCFGLFPPSFYYTHSGEEIERITKGTRARIQTLINGMGPTSTDTQTVDAWKMEDQDKAE